MNTETQADAGGKRRQLQGVVVKRSGAKTISVQVEWSISHPVYRKKIKRTKRYLVHDPKDEATVGERVTIVESRPLSARKRWTLKVQS